MKSDSQRLSSRTVVETIRHESSYKLLRSCLRIWATFCITNFSAGAAIAIYLILIDYAESGESLGFRIALAGACLALAFIWALTIIAIKQSSVLFVDIADLLIYQNRIREGE